MSKPSVARVWITHTRTGRQISRSRSLSLSLSASVIASAMSGWHSDWSASGPYRDAIYCRVHCADRPAAVATTIKTSLSSSYSRRNSITTTITTSYGIEISALVHYNGSLLNARLRFLLALAPLPLRTLALSMTRQTRPVRQSILNRRRPPRRPHRAGRARSTSRVDTGCLRSIPMAESGPDAGSARSRTGAGR